MYTAMRAFHGQCRYGVLGMWFKFGHNLEVILTSKNQKWGAPIAAAHQHIETYHCVYGSLLLHHVLFNKTDKC